MTNEAIYRILDIPAYCNRNRITNADGQQFSFGWAVKAYKYFMAEPSASAISYPAIIWLEGEPHEGTIEITRGGGHAVRLA